MVTKLCEGKSRRCLQTGLRALVSPNELVLTQKRNEYECEIVEGSFAMPGPTNLIINGTFDDGNTGWSGTDLETNHQEKAYLGNGSKNRVAEMDGHRGQTTVMEQTFTVTDPTSTELTLDAALRTASNPNAGTEGFTIDILDSDGVVIATTTVLPTSNSFETVSLPVTFDEAGDYTLRLTEVGPNDSLGAIIDNVTLMVCFAGDTLIETPNGQVAARDLKIGDWVVTQNGPKPVKWVGRRRVTAEDMRSNEVFHPVHICQGALGNGLPRNDLRVSKQHRLQVSSPIAKRMFGDQDVLLPAIRLTALPGIYVAKDTDELDFVHILTEDHEIIYAHGCPAETLLVGPHAWAALTPQAREELKAIFPGIDQHEADIPPALPIPENKLQNDLVSRMAKNGRVPLELFERDADVMPNVA